MVLVDTKAFSYLKIEKIRLRSFASVSLTAQDDKLGVSASLRMTEWGVFGSLRMINW
jgi:hypothetical protein